MKNLIVALIVIITLTLAFVALSKVAGVAVFVIYPALLIVGGSVAAFFFTKEKVSNVRPEWARPERRVFDSL